MRKKFAIFISGEGRGAIEIIKDFNTGIIVPELRLLFSSNPKSYSLKLAIESNIPIAVCVREKFNSRADYEKEILLKLKENNIDYIFLAGYKEIIGEILLNHYPNKIVNIHPSLLPSFKGLNAIDQAMDYGVKITGITTHFVTNEVDGGKIIGQKAVNIAPFDDFISLDAKIFAAGTALTIETINEIFI